MGQPFLMGPPGAADMKELGQSVHAIKSAWNERDYVQAAGQCRRLLALEPGNVYGLIYLARAAAYTSDWPGVIQAGSALARRSPRDAFNAARKLNGAGEAKEAARIFSDIELRSDWFDAKAALLASKQGHLLFTAGQSAAALNDIETAKMLWIAGLRMAPANPVLRSRIDALTHSAKEAARKCRLSADAAGYLEAWREVLRLNPTDVVAAAKVAHAIERQSKRDSVAAWVKVLAIDPTHEAAHERLRKIVERYDVEDRALRGLVELAGHPRTDELVRDLTVRRDAKAQTSLAKALKELLRNAVLFARSVDREAEPRRYLQAWKTVLVLDPQDVNAARKVVSGANRCRDYSELVEGLIAYLQIEPGNGVLAQNLAKAAMRSGLEERALEFLARQGLADLSSPQIGRLQKRVLRACRNAMRALDFDYALTCFRALELADGDDPAVEVLRPVLAQRAASSAKQAEKEGNLGTAVPLAARVLQIVADQPTALTITVRDLWRHKRFADVVALCTPTIKPTPAYAFAQKLLDRSIAKLEG